MPAAVATNAGLVVLVLVAVAVAVVPPIALVLVSVAGPPKNVKSALLRVVVVPAPPAAEELEPFKHFPSAVHVVPVGQHPPPRFDAHL